MAQDFGGDFNGADTELLEIVVRLPAAFTSPTSDEPFHRSDRAPWMMRPLAQSWCSDAHGAVVRITDGAGCAATAVFIGEQDGEAAIDNADERVRRAEIDAEDGGGFRFQVSGRGALAGTLDRKEELKRGKDKK